jgi:hypothetical protein
MSNELRISYPKSSIVTCKAFYDNGGTFAIRGGGTPVVVTLDSDVVGEDFVYSGDADASWVAGDMLVYYDGAITLAAEEYLPTGLSGLLGGGGVISAGGLGNYAFGSTVYFTWGVTGPATKVLVILLLLAVAIALIFVQ